MDEIAIYQEYITTRKIDSYLMQLAIVSSPHSKEPKALYTHLKSLYPVNLEHIKEETIDKSAFERFKSTVMGGSSMEVKTPKQPNKGNI